MASDGKAGPVPKPDNWARVQLAQGQSAAGLWDLSSEVPEARLVVGSAQSAGWIVQASDVQPEHFELFWDGHSLWVSPARQGQVLVDSEIVVDWRQLAGRTRVAFGGAAMMVETSQSAILSKSAVLGGGAPPPIAPPSVDPGSGNGAAQPAGDFGDFLGGDDESTQIYQGERGSLPGDPGTPEEFEVGQTRLLDMSEVEGAQPAGDGLMLEDSRASMSFIDPGTTRILDTEADPSLNPLASDPAARPHFGKAGDTGKFKGVEQERPTQAPDTSMKTDVLLAGAGGQADNKFALPPPGGGVAVAPSKVKLPPVRTMALAGVTLLAALIGLGVVVSRSRSASAIEEAQARLVQQQARVSQNAAQRLAEARTAREQRDARWAEQERAALAAAPPPGPIPTTDDEGNALDERELEAAHEAAAEARTVAIRAASDLVGANDYTAALPHYVRLGRDYADDPAFASMVTILRAKVAAQCRDGRGPGGEPCE